MTIEIGTRIQLTVELRCLGDTAYAGDRGTVKGIHGAENADRQFTVKMDNGRTMFPSLDECIILPGQEEPAPRVIDQQVLDAIEQGRRDMREYLS